MKKILAVVLCLVMVFSLCACSVQGLPKDGDSLIKLLSVLQRFNFEKAASIGGTDTVPGNGNISAGYFNIPAPAGAYGEQPAFEYSQPTYQDGTVGEAFIIG